MKHFYIALTCLFINLGVLFAAPPHLPVKYYVNDASRTGDVFTTAVGNSGNLGTSASAPKATLASVLSTYSASFGVGDTIFVDAGTYTNTDIDLTSPANGVVIIGAGASLTTFVYSNADGYFMNVTTNNTVLMNFQIKGYNGDATMVTEALRIAATNVQVIGVQVNGCRAPETPNGFYPIEVASGSTVTFNGGGATCNSYYTQGGGIHVTGSTTVVTIKNYQIVGNSTGTSGVALFVDGSGTVNVYNSRFVDNSGSSDMVGSAIYQTGGTVKVYDSYFFGNTVDVPDNAIGGAISIAGGTFRITRSYLTSNTYSGGAGIYGNGIGVTNGTVTIDSCNFNSNVASRANDIYVNGGTVTSTNCTFASASNQIGGSGGTFSITNCGNPSIYGATVTKVNVLAPTYTVPMPTLPAYLSNNLCGLSNLLCTPPTISVTSSTQVLCKGSSTGTITVSASGATSPYTYSWTGSAAGATTSPASLPAGTYTVTITDATACSATSSVTITQPVASLAANAGFTASTCGNSNGKVYANPTGGTGSYTYSWSSGATAQTATGLSAATYTATVTDHNACTATSTATITNTAGPSSSITSNTAVKCNGGNNGSLVVTASAGTSPYTYAWSNSTTSSTLSNVAAGTYTVTTTDANGCTTVTIATVGQPAAALAAGTLTPTAITCAKPNGSITMSPTGGTAPYTYAWSNGATTQNLSSVASNTYSVTITDANSCTTSANAHVDSIAIPKSSITSNTAVKCNGGNNGSLVVTATAGTSPYTYAWSNSTTSSTLSNVAAGTYTVTTTDANGCTTVTSATVGQPAAALAAGTLTPTAITCAKPNGSITMSPTGGTSPYTYAWSSGATTQNLSNVASNTYSVTITDANGCTTSANAHVDSIAIPQAIVQGYTAVSCYGGNNGSLTVFAFAGTPNYTYSWSNGQTTASATNLTATDYTVTVTDANGCIATALATVGQPAAALAAGTLTPTSITCAKPNGSISMSPTGGTSPYTYAWSSGATTQNLSNLASTTYSVTITDANGCTTSANAHVDSIAIPQAIVQGYTAVSCYGGNNGSLTVFAYAGTPNYTYSWSNGQTTASATNLSATDYTVTVTDANGCIATALATVGQPAAALAAGTLTPTSITCAKANGSISMSPTGGTSPYTYAWSNGGTTQNLSSVASNTYSVTITDANGCTTSANAHVDSIAIPKSSITTNTAVKCNGGNNGSLVVTATAGTSPYTYAWSNSTTSASATNLTATDYTVTVTDANGCVATALATVGQPSAALVAGQPVITPVTCAQPNGAIQLNPTGGTVPYNYTWSNGSTSQNLNGLTANTYTVTITDLNACSTTAVANIDSIAIPQAIVQGYNNVSCYGGNNGSLTVFAYAGTPGYNYKWSNGLTGAKDSVLTAGVYTVTVTDANGCIAIASATVAQPTAALTAGSLTSTPITCGQANGAVVSNPTGGTLPYTFIWSNTAATQNISGLQPNTYSLTITDANGCVASASALVDSIPVPQAIIQGFNNVSCHGGLDGTLAVFTFNGTPAYTYAWSNAKSTSANLNGVGAGTYTVTVSDVNGCTSTAVATISEPAQSLTTKSVLSNPIKCGQANGSIAVSALGGTSPYSYAWSNGATDSLVTGLNTGSYTLTITDAQNCQLNDTIAVDSIPVPQAIFRKFSNVSCYGGVDGSLNVFTFNGTPNFNYSWSTGYTGSANLTGISAGTYSVTVTDANGCTSAAFAQVSQPKAPLTIASNNIQSPNCNSSNGSISVQVTGGTPGYIYSWSNNATDSVISNVGTSTYSVIVTDTKGCTTQASFTPQAVPVPVISFTSVTNPSCNGSNDGFVIASVQNGLPGYQYQWSDGKTTADQLKNIGAGSYSVTITDNSGCTATNSIDISQPTAISIQLNQHVATCSQPNGSVIATVAGGTKGYTYKWNVNNVGSQDSIGQLLPGNYSVTVTDANGCQLSSSRTLDGSVAAALNVVQAPQTICIGQSTTMAVTAAGGTQPFKYSWSNGLGADPQQNVSPTVTTNYTVQVADSAGCVSQPQVITVNVRKQLVPNVSVGSLDLCKGATARIFAHPTGGDSTNYNFHWSPVLSADSGLTIQANMAQVYTVTVGDNCSQPVTATVALNVKPNPIVNITSLPDSVCGNNFTFQFNATPASGGNVSQYWSYGDNTYGADGKHQYSAAGDYNVSVTVDSNGCSATATANNLAIVKAKPQAAFTYSTIDGGYVIQDSLIQFTNNSTGQVSQLWQFGFVTNKTQDSSNVENPNYTYREPGAYTVLLTVTAANGCTDKTAQVLDVQPKCTFPDHIPNVFSPNGDNKNDYFIVSGAGFEILESTIYNRWGTEVFKYNAKADQWDGRTFSGGIAPEGTYYYVFEGTCKIGGKAKALQGFITLVK